MPCLALLLCASLATAQTPIRGFPSDDLKAQRDRETQAKAVPQADRLKTYVKRISVKPHHAGSPAAKAVAEYAMGLMKEWGLDSHIETFDALLPYPTSRTLEMTGPTRYTAKLKEPVLPEDLNTRDANQLPTYNAYSASGDVTAPLVYVNYGIAEDYGYLKQQGIDVTGKIVIARYGKSWRGVKPKLAQEHGAVGCLIYSDPRDDGYFMGDVYPKGPFRPEQGVQRGSVVDMPLYPGDPLTPGWASEKGGKKLSRSEANSLLKIPVLPISYGDAQPLLQHLGGPVAPESWRGALPITYHIGPGAATVHLKLDFDWSTKPVHNVITTIAGTTFKDQWVIYGNHHDAWVNGASDPTSGAAALLETARSLATLVKQGWKPKRTIMLALWDAEEFGLVGSTEWGEKHQDELEKKAAVYINSDSNGKGSINAGGSHSLEQFVTEVLRDVQDPATGKNLLDARRPRRNTALPAGATVPPADGIFRLSALGSGSDYVVFIDHLGVSSLNLGFGGEGGGGVYHSIYDSYRWYTNFSDSDFKYGRALAQVMSTSLMRLADSSVLPFEFGNLARTVRGYIDDIQKDASKLSKTVDFMALNTQVARLEANAKNYEELLAGSDRKIAAASTDKLAKLNESLMQTERALASKGLPGRDWYRHQLYAPGLYTGYGAKTLPGVREAVEGSRWDEANQQAQQAAGALKGLNKKLEEATKLLREL